MKRFLIICLILCALIVNASAATINMENVKPGEQYSYYKIFEYEKSADGEGFSYFINNENFQLINFLSENGFNFHSGTEKTYLISAPENAEQIVEIFNNNIAELEQYALDKNSVVAEDLVQWENLSTGYYFITSSLGSLCELKSYNDEVIIFEKNTIPSVDKTQDVNGSNYINESQQVSIGDTVFYQLEITDGIGTNQSIVVTDLMSNGLDFNNDIKVYKDSVQEENLLTQEADYTLSAQDHGFTLELLSQTVELLDSSEKIFITYSATVNKDAEIGIGANKNDVTLQYSNQTLTDTISLDTYDFTIQKVDGETQEALTGASFILYDPYGVQVKINKDNIGYYYDPSSTSYLIEVDSSNGVNVRGLRDFGQPYELEEVNAPAGYNVLNNRIQVNFADNIIKVENFKGVVLPSTGGVGNTGFYAVGGSLAALSVIIFTVKKLSKKFE